MNGTIDYKLLEEISIELKKIANDMQFITDKVTENVKEIEKNGFWSGNAADYFQKQFNLSKQNFDEAYEQVTNYALYLENIVMRYQKFEESISKMIG